MKTNKQKSIPEGAVQMKVWRRQQADEYGISESAVAMMLMRKTLQPKLHRINARVVYVIP